ncbi:DUF898 family protein [Lactobacillus porci]|uniref:DUF6693 family protein n=1 Tax=Lactobacillus porci TaxID=2012477 RepID=UPI003992571D
MYCTHCGTKLPEGAKFCTNCGTPVEKAAPQPAKTPAKEKSVINQVDKGIDQLGDEIGHGIDDAAKDITSGIMKTGKNFQQNMKTTGSQFSEKTADFSKNWRDYLTLENLEKVASVALLLPLFMKVVLWVLGFVLDIVISLPIIGNVFQVVYLLINAIFLIVSALGIVSAVYVLVKDEAKRTVWGWLTLAGLVFAFLGCIAINQANSYFDWMHPGVITTFKVLGWIAVVWGIDTCSRVLLQKSGIGSEVNVSRDWNAYQEFYQTYRAEHEKEEKAEAGAASAGNGQVGSVSYFDGTGLGFFGTCLLYTLLTLITCGFAGAWYNCAVQRWKTEHMVVDGKRVTFNGTGASLLGHWFLWEFLSLITCGIFAFFIPVALQKWNMNHTYYEGEKGAADSGFDGNSFQYFGYNLMQLLVLMLTLGLAYPWTHNMMLRWLTRHQVINNDRLYYDGTALGMFFRAFVGSILSVITFGIFTPWANCWLWRYQYSHTHVDHDAAK